MLGKRRLEGVDSIIETRSKGSDSGGLGCKSFNNSMNLSLADIHKTAELLKFCHDCITPFLKHDEIKFMLEKEHGAKPDDEAVKTRQE
jgi:hypothetical protein